MTAKEWKDIYWKWRSRFLAKHDKVPDTVTATHGGLDGNGYRWQCTSSITIHPFQDPDHSLFECQMDCEVLGSFTLCKMIKKIKLVCIGLDVDGEFIADEESVGFRLEDLAKQMKSIIDQSYERKVNKMKFVTLIGSSRFYDEFLKIKQDMEADGETHVLIPEIFTVADPKKLTVKDHYNLDILHQEKMRMAEYVLVVNKDGYIGKDTMNEIDWCKSNNIPLRYLEPESVAPRRSLLVQQLPNVHNPVQQVVNVTDPVTGTKNILEFRNRLTVSTEEYVEFWVKEYLYSQGKLSSEILDKIKVKVDIELAGLE